MSFMNKVLDLIGWKTEVEEIETYIELEDRSSDKTPAPQNAAPPFQHSSGIYLQKQSQQLPKMSSPPLAPPTNEETPVYRPKPKPDPSISFNPRASQESIVSHLAKQQIGVVILSPKDFEDSKEVSKHLKNRKHVVVNITHLEKALGQRVLDFLTGIVSAHEGSIKKAAVGIFVIAPHGSGEP